MNFSLFQLHSNNRTKPLVKLYGIDGWLQWDTCDLKGLPPEREPGGLYDMGKIPKGQYDNLPTVFTATTKGRFIIKNIHTLKPNDI